MVIENNKNKLIGKIFNNEKYGKYKVLNFDYQDKYYNKYYKIKFLKTGYITLAFYGHILKGNIKDRLSPVVFGIGYLGDKGKKDNRRAYLLWKSLIRRCYSEEFDKYSAYGGKGVKVSDRWHCFEKFLKDLFKIDGYDKEKFQNGSLELDKDLKQQGEKSKNKVYSLETCIFLSRKDHKRIKQKYFKAINPEGKEFISNNQNKFAHNHNLNQGTISYCLHEDRNHHKGWKFEFIK